MPKVNELQVAAWSVEAMLAQPLRLTRFHLSDGAQDTLLTWCRERTKRPDEPVKMALHGLSEVTGLLVPDIAFLRDEWDPQARVSRLCFYFLEDRCADAGLRARMQLALGQWLGALYPTKPNAARTTVAKCALADAHWSVVSVDPTLTLRTGLAACPNAKDGLLWDAVTAQAVAALAGKELLFRSDERRTLVVKTPQSGLFNGVELLAYPPKSSRDGQRFWSEAITLCTATFPEQEGVFLLARLSIRNWGPVIRPQRQSDSFRSLDIFVEPEPSFVGSAAGGWRHGSFEYRATVDRDSVPANGRPTLHPVWRHQTDRDMFRLLQAFTGNTEAGQATLAQPLLNRAGLSVLPRLGSAHGDDQLPGGTGLPWPDREDIMASLHRHLAPLGLEQATGMRRVVRRARNLPKCLDEAAGWRQSVLTALKNLGNENGQLDLLMFRKLEQTPRMVVEELREFLGKPAKEKGGVLRWDDGLTIRVLDFPAGPLAEELPPWQKLSAEEAGRYAHEEQRRAYQKAKRQEMIEKVGQAMVSHVAEARRGAAPGVACALLEMSADLKNDPWLDPFDMARQTLARARCLPKVILTGTDGAEHKYRYAVRDVFRLLGASPVAPSTLTGWDTVSAVTIIQRNAKFVAGRKRLAHAFPLAARVRDGVFDCALFDPEEGMCWMPYGQAVLQVLTGEYKQLSRGRQSEAQFARFFAEVFDDLGRSGNSLVIAAKELVSKVHTLQNGELEFDRLTFGNQIFRPKDLPSVRLVRIDNDHTKQPCYSHEADSKWVQGLFQWGPATRTLYALKPKPPSISDESSYASQASRHDPQVDGGGYSHVDTTRVTPQLGEFCAAFQGDGDDPHALIANVFALCKTHVQYDYHTNLPFPLHELMRVGKNVT